MCEFKLDNCKKDFLHKLQAYEDRGAIGFIAALGGIFARTGPMLDFLSFVTLLVDDVVLRFLDFNSLVIRRFCASTFEADIFVPPNVHLFRGAFNCVMKVFICPNWCDDFLTVFEGGAFGRTINFDWISGTVPANTY